MNKSAGLSLGVLAVAIAAGGGYWLGGSKNATHQASGAPAAVAASESAKKERKLLYYRNPMGLPDTSPVPKKDPMGMDYIPVYEGEQDDEPAAANQIKISVEKVQKLGVRTEAAQLRALDKVVRAAGRVEPDERRIYAISPKFEGYVERLHVNVTGQPVGKGQPLFEVYSPELVSAQREYAIAAQGVESLKGAGGSAQDGMKQLADSSLLRLKNWDISEEQVKALAKSGEARRTLTFRSPVAGIVTEKKALQGVRFMPGEALYQVADLSAVWVVADVFEQDIGQVKTGAKAKVRINAYPDKTFEGTITYVYPTLKSETRTVPVRVELQNPGQLLKPAMFAQVELPVGGKGEVVTVPTSAVIDSGTRRIVLVQAKEGRFEPREVKLGQRSDNYVEVQEGVKNGEPVVVAANFLIDAESNLKAAVGGFGHASHGGSAPKQDAAAAAPAGEHAGHQESKPAVVGHQAEGTVEGFDVKATTISIAHGPIPSLKWPGMTMEFTLANPGLLSGIKPGLAINFEFVERKPGEWVVTAIKPGASKTANPHAGH
ncbi:efflux RND transporter periplasmic adaptor subunit [Dechloromonas sp. ARDL1]|uniref:efflux RND transporter periplasmic adaptor subunit n=1 Tax=Dechloromonas sp. ARDL1 TaxID=3322121 RepID=UPI003DA6F7E1